MSYAKNQLTELYRRRAAHYDFSANLYYLIGFREYAYRKQAVAALNLAQGDTVVELGCGTGLNFSLLQEAIGPTGKIIGVDLTQAMLAQAEKRVEENGWSNIELIHSDANSFQFPEGVGGVISSFALTLAPDYDVIIKRAVEALPIGKRLVVLDLKRSERLPLWVSRFGATISRPFGVTLDLADRHPWESIERYMNKVLYKEFFMGFAYISAGERR